MSLPFAVAIYFIAWWIGLFVVLPFFTHAQQDAGQVTPGTPRSAPARPRLLAIAAATSLLALVVLAAIQGIVVYDPLGVRELITGLPPT